MPQHARILIATPSRDQTVSFAYVKSLFEIMNWFKAQNRNVTFDLKLGSFTSIDSARNYFATLVLEQIAISHLLFIDSDHGFQAELIDEMITFNKPIVGAIYPAKHLNFGHILRQAKRADSPQRLEALHASFVRPDFIRSDGNQVEIIDGFARVALLGTGIMLIQREVLERMALLPDMLGTGHALLTQQGFSGRVLQCFRPLISPSNIPMGEDVSFCKRWTDDCAGELWANVSHEITHVGPYWFKGRLMDRYG